MSTLFDPVKLGAILAPNRLLMAPLTRARATRDHIPTPVMADYYRQRAPAGLVISEGIGISRQGLGWPCAPGIWSAEQVKAWKPVTEAVHDAGGRIFAQLWHMGRLVHSSMTGEQPVSSSTLVPSGQAHSYEGEKPYEQPIALELKEIPSLISTYVTAAGNTIEAGFDGVQIHAANGYLLNGFLRDSVNQRQDAYGGSPNNRVRLLREISEAVADAIGPARVAEWFITKH